MFWDYVLNILSLGFYRLDFNFRWDKRKWTRYIASHTNRKFKNLWKETKEMDWYDVRELYHKCLNESRKNIKESIDDINKPIW